MPKIVGYMGASGLPQEIRFEWLPTIMAGATSYVLAWLASKMPGRALMPNAPARLPEFKPAVLAKFENAIREARSGERNAPVPAAVAKRLRDLPPGRFSYDTAPEAANEDAPLDHEIRNRKRVRQYKGKTSLRGAMRSTSRAASESAHAQLLVDTRGAENADGTFQPAKPVLISSYREDGAPTFFVTTGPTDIPEIYSPLASKEQRLARRRKRMEDRAARAQKLSTQDQQRAEKKAKRAAEREDALRQREALAAAAKIEREKSAAERKEAAAERKETALEREATLKEHRIVQGRAQAAIAKPRRGTSAPAAPKPRKRQRATEPAAVRESVLAEAPAAKTVLRVAEEVSPKQARALLKKRVKELQKAEEAEGGTANYLVDYAGMKGQARVLDTKGEIHYGDVTRLRAAGLAPGTLFYADRSGNITPAPDAKTTLLQRLCLEKIAAHTEMKPNDPRWGRRAAGLLVIARDTGRMLLTLRSAEVMEPHTWALPGGRCEDEDNDPRACAVRELREETGYGGKLSVLVEPVHVYREPGFEFHNFVGFVDHEFEPELDWENDDAGWFSPSKLPSPAHFGVRELFQVADRQICALISKV